MRPKAWEAEHDIADRVAPSIRRALESAFRRAALSLPLTDLANLYVQGAARLVDEFPWNAITNALTEDVSALLQRAMVAAAKAQPIPGVVVKIAEFRFDITNPRAQRWVTEHAAELVVQVDAETRRAINRIIQRMFEDNITPQQAARELRAIIGLHERYALAVDNYRRGLTGMGTDPEKVIDRVTQYAERLRRQRAEVIARTESITASAQGQLELWRQAREAGILDPRRTKRQWLATPDSRVCPLCDPMHLQVVGMEEPFTTGEFGKVMTPPVHPQCRCAVRLVFDPLPTV